MVPIVRSLRGWFGGRGMDPIPAFVFAAYFVTEIEFDGLGEAIPL